MEIKLAFKNDFIQNLRLTGLKINTKHSHVFLLQIVQRISLRLFKNITYVENVAKLCQIFFFQIVDSKKKKKSNEGFKVSAKVLINTF